MSKTLSRQRNWQVRNPGKARLLREQTKLNQRKALFQQGYVKTHEEIYDIIVGYERRHGKLTDAAWWDAYEYLDWKYNNGKLCKPDGGSNEQ